MKKISVSEILRATGGALIAGSRETLIDRVSKDTRELSPGMLFVAIPGERVDGHDFIEEAIEKGCAAVLISAKRDRATVKALEKGVAIIRVADTVTGLQELAAYYLSLFPIKKIAVTGSSGKTTTKEMLYWILSERYKTVRNLLNYNNNIGLPLSIFNVEEETEAAVFEMGMDSLGEIHRLAELVRPDVGVITNVGIAHVERLGSRENILKAKMEIVDFFGKDNTLVVNKDSNLLSENHYEGDYRLLTAGTDGEVRLENVFDGGEGGVSFTLIYRGESVGFHLPVPGRHNAFNAAVAVGAALCCGVTMEEARRGLEKFVPTDKRGFVVAAGEIRIIDDTYNANPESMRAAMDMLTAVNGGRKVAILGDMGELGADAESYHRQLGEYAARQGVKAVISIGNHSRFFSSGAAGEGPEVETRHFAAKEDFQKEARQWIRPGDVVLVKGSRFMEMDRIVELLKQEFTQ